MSNKHTPGPWGWADNPSGPWPKLIGPDEEGGWIAMSSDPNGADAHLIAAAPDLLKALTYTLSMSIEAAADACGGISLDECEDFGWVKDARAVIAKAKGDEA